MNFDRGSTNMARNLVKKWIRENLCEVAEKVNCGLPEYDDRLNLWRTSLLLNDDNRALLGEIQVSKDLDRVVDATEIDIIYERLKKESGKTNHSTNKRKGLFKPAPIPNKVILGDSINILEQFPRDTAQLIVTSPPIL